MPLQRVPDTAEVAIHYNVNGQECTNVTHWYNPTGSPFNLAALAGLAADVGDAWRDGVLGQLSNTVIMGDVVATDIGTVGGLQFVYSANSGNAGGQASPALPGNVAFAVKFTTGHTGRSFRGRNYISGITEAEVTGNLLSVGNADAFVDAYVAMQTAAATDGWDFVVVSRTLNGVTLTPPVHIPVTNVSYTDLRTDSMRSRL